MSGDIFPITFRGVDEGSDPKTQPAGTLLRATNCVMDKARRLLKRAGTVPLGKTRGDAGALTAGKKLIVYPSGGLGIYDGQDVFQLNEQDGKWYPTDRVSPLAIESYPLTDSVQSVAECDTAIIGKLLFVAYKTGATRAGLGSIPGQLYYRVDDLASGLTVHNATLISGSLNSHPVILEGATDVFVVYSTTSKVKAVRINKSSFAMGVPVEVSSASDATVTPDVFSACIGTSSAGEVIYVAYTMAVGADRLRIRSFLTATLTQDQTIVEAGSGTVVGAKCISFCPLASKVAVIVVDLSVPTTRISILSVDLVASTGLVVWAPLAATVGIGNCFVEEFSSTEVVVGFSASRGTQYYLRTGKADMATLTVASATLRVSRNLTNPSRPWKLGGRWYVASLVEPIGDGVSFGRNPQQSYVIVEIEFYLGVSGVANTEHHQMAVLENLTACQNAVNLTKVSVDDFGNAWVMSAYGYAQPADENDLVRFGWNIHKIVIDGPGVMRQATVGAAAFCSGGSPSWNDGGRIQPLGFVNAPKITSVLPVAGGTLVQGDYSYVACYAWVDDTGVLHRSLPSPPFLKTLAGAGNNSFEITITTTSLGAKQKLGLTQTDVAQPVLIELYRTAKGGTVHHLLVESLMINDPTVTAPTVIDSLPDSDVSSSASVVPLTSQPVLYTETGELGNVPAPASIACSTHLGRLVVIDSFRRSVWLTKDSTEDPRVAQGFNEALVIAFASDKVALGSLDEKLVVYGRSTIDIVHGKGPDATGSGEWQTQSVQTDVGCVNPLSTVTCPSGAVFKSSRGIELLSRELVVAWIGKAIQDVLAAYPVITSATLVADSHEVRFTCNTADGISGVVLAWDYYHQIWFTRNYRDTADTNNPSVPFVDAALIGGIYTMLTAGGQIYLETGGHRLDGGISYVERDIILADISPAGPMGWCRVKDLSVMGTSITDHNMSTSFARDYAAAFEQTKGFVAATPPVSVGPLSKCRITLKNQQCRAVKIRIRDLAPTAGTMGTGDGAIYEGLALRVVVKPGVAKTARTEQG